MEWKQDAKELLEELLSPIPAFVRPMAKKKIEAAIVNEAKDGQVTKEAVIKGYIASSSDDMKERALKVLKAKGIDVQAYQS